MGFPPFKTQERKTQEGRSPPHFKFHRSLHWEMERKYKFYFNYQTKKCIIFSLLPLRFETPMGKHRKLELVKNYLNFCLRCIFQQNQNKAKQILSATCFDPRYPTVSLFVTQEICIWVKCPTNWPPPTTQDSAYRFSG